ncbi:MAG: aminotransferase class I/II-fold pyridoxal phosphate-dependent enzyme [Massiliimalia sp.]
MAKTPIWDFIKQWNEKSMTRFFMPGHKGFGWKESHPLNRVFSLDITEIDGADVLFSAQGIIRESEQEASRLFGSELTVYSAGGSTLCIQTMLTLAAKRGRKILAGRNAHMAFIRSCVLLDLEPVWLLPKTADAYGVCGRIEPQQVKEALTKNPDVKTVYLTSPDYLGNTVSLEEIAEICQSFGAWLLVDNAHGAYLKFTGQGKHPLEQGATLCCDSAHKTLPTLTGAAYLHGGKGCGVTAEQVKEAMSCFGSSSPSYLILLSLDLCNEYLEIKAAKDWACLRTKVMETQHLLQEKGIGYLPNPVDFSKITLDAGNIGYTGEQLADYFRQWQIEPEYVNEQYVVYLTSPGNTDSDWERFWKGIDALSVNSSRNLSMCPYAIPPKRMSPREAFFSSQEQIGIEFSVGRISAQTVASCPPGVPLVVPGEQITENIKNICKNSGNVFIKVVK